MVQILLDMEMHEEQGVSSEFLVDTVANTMYIRTRMAGQCWVKTAATEELKLIYQG